MKHITLKANLIVVILIALACAGATPVGARRASGEVGPDRSGRGPCAQTGDTPITKAVWSPDGSLLAIPASPNIYLYTAGNDQPRILTGADTVHQLAFSPDSQQLGMAGFWLVDDTRVSGVRLWDTATGALISTWELTYVATHLTFTPDGTALGILAWSFSDLPNSVLLLQSLDNSRSNIFEGFSAGFHTQHIVFSPDQSQYATITYVSQLGSGRLFPIINVWNSQTGQLQHEMWMEGRDIAQLIFDPRNNGQMVSLQESGVVRFWNAQSGEQLFALTLPYERVSAVTFSDDGEHLATGGPDGVVRLWESSTGAMTDVIEGPARAIDRIDYLRDGTLLAYSIMGDFARKWDVHSGRELLRFDLSDIPVNKFDTNFIPSPVSKHRQTMLARIGTDSPNAIPDQQDYPRILKLVWSPDGAQLVAATTDGADMYIVADMNYELHWHIESETSGQTFPGSDHWVTAAAFSPDGQVLALAEGDGLVQIWDAQQSTRITTFQDNRDATQTLAFSPDGQTLAAGGGYFPSRHGADYVIHLWDTSTWTRREFTEVPRFGEMRSIAFSADGHYLAYGGIHGYLPICDATSGDLISAIHPETESVDELAFSPDDRYLAFSGYHSVQLWELHQIPEFHLTLRQRWTFVGANQPQREADEWPLTNIAFRDDGHILFATATASGAVRVWDARSNAIIAEFAQAGAAIWTGSFDPEGRRLAAADERGTIYIWTLPNLDD